MSWQGKCAQVRGKSMLLTVSLPSQIGVQLMACTLQFELVTSLKGQPVASGRNHCSALHVQCYGEVHHNQSELNIRHSSSSEDPIRVFLTHFEVDL